jgi:non-ribosomal peptide synthase protein (TIGR01720 family)
LILNVSDVGNAVDAVKIVKDEVRHVPHNGIGYSILRYLGDAKPLAGYAHPRILLNHLGAGTHPTTGPLRFVGFDNTIPAMRHVNSPKASIQITSRVYHDALEVFWMCNETVFKKSTVATVAEGMASVLRQLIAECENDARS